MRTVLALAIALFTTAPFPASAEQNNAQPLTEAAFAARSAELRGSAKALQSQIERCTEKRASGLPSKQSELRPLIRQTCARLFEGIASGRVNYARYKILRTSDARDLAETLN